MSEKNIDKLLSQTDSKYKLSVAIAKRAMQLKSGVVPVISPDQRTNTRNLITVAMREMATGKLEMGANLIDQARLDKHLAQEKQRQAEELQRQQAGSYQMPEFDND
jgi:DNA-directed RNA polymerase subunit omega